MQWADDSLLDFIDYLLDWSRNHSLFIATFARPEFTDKRPGWGAGRRSFTSLYLEPLSPQAMEDLLAGLVPGLPQDLLTRILSRAEGVPLYAVETVRMLIDRGLLVPQGSVYRPTKPVETLDVPETLQALIAARLDGLTLEERRLVQDGSVLGKMFTVPALSCLSGRSEEEVESLLAALVRKEVLSLQTELRSPERGHYGFLQDLLKRVAYETLSKKERKARRLAAASFLESGGTGDDDVEVIAVHYLEAYRELPDSPDAQEIRQKAQEMLAKAGDRAASLAAQTEAERYFVQAAELMDDDASKARLWERAGQMAYQGGRLEEGKVHYQHAMELFDSRSDSHSAARVSARLSDIEWDQGRLVDSVDRMERAFAVLSAEEPDADLATLAAQLGRLQFFKGEVELARRRLEVALEIAEPRGLSEVVSQALNTKGIVLLFEGRKEESIALIKHSLEVALENDFSAAALRAYVNMAETMFRVGRYEESLDKYEEGLALARRVGNRVWEWALLAEMTFPLFVVGRWNDAVERSSQIPETEMARADILGPLLSLPLIAVIRQDLEGAKRVLSVFSRFESSEDVQERAAHAVARAVTHLADNDAEGALGAAQEAIRLGRQIGPDSQMLMMGLDQGLEAALATSDFASAEGLLEIIDSLHSGQMTPMLRAIRGCFGARLAMVRGLDREAEAGFKQAVGMFREITAPYWLATTLVEFGEWLVSQENRQHAGPLLAEAGRIFEDLDAPSGLERVSRALRPTEPHAPKS
jgi:tetratricopeptide (TPR) repeat protein